MTAIATVTDAKESSVNNNKDQKNIISVLNGLQYQN